MTENGTNGTRWKFIERAAGLVIVACVIGLRAAGLMEWQDAQFLLGIAACCIFGVRIWRGGNK